jgi:hypothetical protein
VPPLLEVLDELGRAHRRVARVGGRGVQLVLLDLEERRHRVAHVLSREETAEALAERARVVERVLYRERRRAPPTQLREQAEVVVVDHVDRVEGTHRLLELPQRVLLELLRSRLRLRLEARVTHTYVVQP